MSANNTEVIAPGIYTDIDSDRYHAAQGVSKSGLDHFRRSPAHYQAWLKEKPEETPALRFGKLAHMSQFEPIKFTQCTAIAPVVDRRTKEGKAIWQQFQEENAGRELITIDERDQLVAMREVVMRHPVASKMLESGLPEVSIFAKCVSTGLTLKCRFDWLFGDDNEHAVDYKTTEDASPAAFARSIAQYRYHVQQVHYTNVAKLHGRSIKSFTFIAQEKKPPYAVAVYRIDPADITVTEVEYRRQLEAVASCEQFGSWPAYSTDLATLSLPKWAAGQIDNTNI